MNTAKPQARTGASRPLALALGLALALPGAAGAVRLDYEVGLSALRSDNIALRDGEEIEDTVLMPWLTFGATHESSALRLDARGNLQYLHYVDDTFDDGLRGALSGQATWTVVEERLDLVVEDYLSRQPVDSLMAFSPDNEQQANVFTAGPTLRARLGGSGRGEIDLRYANSRAEDNPAFDSDRFSAALRAIRDLDTTRTLSGSLEATEVDYDVGDVNDYVRYDAYASYGARLRSIDATVDVGYSRVEPEGPRESDSAPLFRTRLAWRPTARSTLDLAASHAIADAAQDLMVLETDDGTPQVPIVPDLYRQQRVEFGYQYQGARFDARVRPYYQRVKYLDRAAQPPDESGRGGVLDLGMRLRPLTRLSFVAALDRRDIGTLDRVDEDLSAGLFLDHSFTRHWQGTLGVQHRRRDSNDAAQEYAENVVVVGFSFRR